MQDAVTSGVMKMDKFADRVNHSVTDTHAIGLRFGKIIQQVQVLVPECKAVHKAMRFQSASARQIRDAMVSLTESVLVSAQALGQPSAPPNAPKAPSKSCATKSPCSSCADAQTPQLEFNRFAMFMSCMI